MVGLIFTHVNVSTRGLATTNRTGWSYSIYRSIVYNVTPYAYFIYYYVIVLILKPVALNNGDNNNTTVIANDDN